MQQVDDSWRRLDDEDEDGLADHDDDLMLEGTLSDEARGHGRSQSSFRSYTNHHMGSGSNHFVTDDEDDDAEMIDCETCLDR